VLEVLHQNDGITQSKLAATVRLERSSMVPMLDKLARRGLLERRASTTDRRHNHLHLTDAGRELLAEALRRASQHEKEVCKPFTIAEKKLLLELLGRFRARKNPNPPERDQAAPDSRRDTRRRSQRLPSSWW
jgi:DNA-binding MarR family transcriptional regulator